MRSVKKVTDPSAPAVVMFFSGRPQTEANDPYCFLFCATYWTYWSTGQLLPGPERQDGIAANISETY